MSPSERVVVTGFGHTDAWGCGLDALRQTFLHGPKLSDLDTSMGYHRTDGSKRAVLVDDSGFGPWLSPRQARRMSPPSRFAVVAARIAWQMAKLEDHATGERTAVVTSTCYGPSSYTEQLLRQILLQDPTQASPFLFTEAVANASAAQIALSLKARGANITISQREAGPVLALAKGANEIRAGRADRVVVAAVDEANPLLHAVLDRFGVLAGSRGGSQVACPFDLNRRGFLLGEGASVWILESESEARKRGAEVLAYLGPWVGAFDPTASAAGYGHGTERLASRLLRGLSRAGESLDGVDLVVAGSAGGRDGDLLEAGVLRHFWPGQMPPIFVPKAHTAEHGGGLLSGTALAMIQGEASASPGFETEDPELGLVPWGGGQLPAARKILVSAPAVGGSMAWILIEPGSGFRD